LKIKIQLEYNLKVKVFENKNKVVETMRDVDTGYQSDHHTR
jgi:hypothetical protein